MHSYPDYKRCPDGRVSSLRGTTVPVFNAMYYTVPAPRVLHFIALVVGHFYNVMRCFLIAEICYCF